MNIAVLGAGNMGTALAVAASEGANNNILLWSIEEDVVKSINESHINKKYLKNNLSSKIKATLSLNEAVKGADIVVFCVPSSVVRSVAEKAKGLISRRAVILNAAKGFEAESNKRLSEILKEYFNNPIVCIGGPSIANELADSIPTYVVFASTDDNAIKTAARALSTKNYIISATNDLVGVEVLGFLKNVYAIMAGISDGLGYGINTKAGIVAKMMDEIKLVCKGFKVKDSTVYGLAGLGDLLVTCTSVDSRNRRFGELLGKGLKRDDALKRIGQIVEGEKAAVILKKMMDNKRIKAPIAEKIYNIIINGEEPDVPD